MPHVRYRNRAILLPKDESHFIQRFIAGDSRTALPCAFFLSWGACVMEQNPAALENRIEKTLGETPAWAWGGGGAAMRLTKHYRGEETILHVETAPPDLPKRLRALPAQDGPLTILRAPGKIGFAGVLPRTVHPLLVFTELLTTGNERAREAAQEIRERYLELHA